MSENTIEPTEAGPFGIASLELPDPEPEPTAAELGAWARGAIRAHGVRGACRELGLPRPVLMALAAEAPVRAGSRVLAQQRYGENRTLERERGSIGDLLYAYPDGIAP